MTVVALTIAGSDPSGGAGLQADLKTFHQHGVYGMSVVTLLTVQNTQSVYQVKPVEAKFVLAQLDGVIRDIPPAAAKTGALGTAEIIAGIADRAPSLGCPLVVDPVMISKHGSPLLPHDACKALRTALLPLAYLITPNLQEAAALLDRPVIAEGDTEAAARALADLGPANVLITGGALRHDAADVLYSEGTVHTISGQRLSSTSTHGSGCVLSAAITAHLALGADLLSAVKAAKRFVTEAIRTGPGLGHGVGPTNMLADPML